MVLTITLDDRLVEGFSKWNRYEDDVDDGQGSKVPNPESKEEFFKKILADVIKKAVLNYETELALEKTRVNLEDFLTNDPKAMEVVIK